MDKTILRAKGIKKFIRNYEILKGIDLEVKRGEFLSVMGPSGSGKSTLLYILGLLDAPDDGELFLLGKKVNFSMEKELSFLRNNYLGFVFQFHYLIPELTALENVIIPLLKKGLPFSRAREKGKEILERLGLGDKLNRKPYQLSGGEQQRVAIARALANEPVLLLADEPTGNLDSVNTQNVMNIFKEINGEGTTIVMVTHEEELAKQTHRTLILRDGKVVEERVNT
ncbi:ABC transporter ATP-binding protein [Aquifex pyrophilus]